MPAGMDYTLRLDDHDGARDLLRDLLGPAGRYLVVREEPEGNPHYHVVWRDDRKLPALRKWLQRRLQGVGNGVYSLKQCGGDVERLVQYCCKGASADTLPEVVMRQGWSEAELQAAHERYWVENTQIQANRLKRKRILGATLIEKLEEQCKHKGIRVPSATAKQEIAREYIRMRMDARMPINVYHARGCVNTVYCLMCGDDSAIDELANTVAYN